MSDSNRLLIAAAAIGLIVCALIWGTLGVGVLTSSPERAAHNGYVRAERGDRYYESDNAILALTNEACAQASETADEDAARGNTNKRDLCAQYLAATAARQSASYSVVQTWIGFVGFGFVIFGLVLNWSATKAATEQAAMARRAIPQPFLQVDPKEFRLASDDRRGLLRTLAGSDSAKFVLHNHGAAPGVLVHVQSRLDLLQNDEPFPGFVTGDPVEPNMLVHGLIVGADKDSAGLWASRTRKEGESGFSELDDWWLHGYAVYSDGKDRYFALGFCFGFAGFGWIRATPPGCRNGDANYHREISKNPAWLV